MAEDMFIPYHVASRNLGCVNRKFSSTAKLLQNILHWQVSVLKLLLK